MYFHLWRERAEHHRNQVAQQQPGDGAEQAQRDRFGEELQQYLAAGGAEGLEDADLPGSLGNRYQHDVHDADAAHQQRNTDDGDRDGRDDAGYLASQLGDCRVGFDGEVVFVVRPDVVRSAQHALEPAAHGFHVRAFCHGGHQVELTVLCAEQRLHRVVGNVRWLAKRAQQRVRRLQDADHAEPLAGERHMLADRLVAKAQALGGWRRQYANASSTLVVRDG